MANTADFDVSPSPDRVIAYLADPRNLIVANHQGHVVERSDPPNGIGSWAVLAFDQLRVRVEYTSFEPPDLVAVAVTHTGRGSGGLSQIARYHLGPAAATGGTHTTLEMDGSGGFITRAVNGLTWPLIWRRLRDRMERDAI